MKKTSVINNYSDINEFKNILITNNFNGVIVFDTKVLKSIDSILRNKIFEKFLNQSSIFGIFLINNERINDLESNDDELFEDIKNNLRSKNNIFFSNTTEDNLVLLNDYIKSIELITIKAIFNILDLHIHIFFEKEQIYMNLKHFTNICFHFMNSDYTIDEMTKVVKKTNKSNTEEQSK